MAEFKLERIRYRWKGDWTAGISYIADDVVRYDGKTYTCLVQHTADADFYTDLNFLNSDVPPVPEPKWELMVDGYSWKSTWTPGILYPLGSIVRYSGVIYRCIAEHTSSAGLTGFDLDTANWAVQVSSDNWTADWTVSTYYGVGSLVKYGGIVYRCATSHVSAATITIGIEPDLSKWTVISETYQWQADWTISTKYQKNDVVKYGGYVYRCTAGHTSAATEALGLETDIASWILIKDGIEYKGAWTPAAPVVIPPAVTPVLVGTRYKKGDIVKYGANAWRCTTYHSSIVTFDETKWEIFVPGFEYEFEWSSAIPFQPGDVVRYGGYQYVSLTNNLNKTPSLEATDWELLTLGTRIRGEWYFLTPYLVGDLVRRNGQAYSAVADSTNQDPNLGNGTNTAYWQLVVPGEQWQATWTPDTEYAIGDLVNYIANVYRCISIHTATIGNRPDNDYENNYWTLHTYGTQTNVMSAVGDVKTYGIMEDGSSIGNRRLAIGEIGEILKIVEGEAQWTPLWQSEKLYYVGPDGIDDDKHGLTINTPWKTIRYACENITGVATILIKHGVYEEILPIRVPAFVGLCGDELRGVEIRPAPTKIPAGDKAKTLVALNYFKDSLLPDIMAATEIPALLKYSITSQDISAPAGSNASAVQADSLLSLIIDIIDDTGSPTLTGTDTATVDAGILAGRTQIINNKQFIIDEVIGYMNFAYPSYTFNEELCRRDLGLFIDSMLYDMLYTGTWKSYEAGNYYANAADGDRNARQSMFYMRDATGLRNVTCTGLIGDLTGFDPLYLLRRVDGGAFVSLDPGYGPADASAWITTRSPYMQNCTMFGTKCVGAKIDGYLHNGGNKSMVANDFTQVLDDGIGVWVIGEGKTELVSVFTYYNYIGYLAEDGARIRATNGNNSYGNYGSVSLGSNPVEVPITCELNNRYYNASIDQTLCHEGKIMKIFFDNAGESYTQADFSVIGSGLNLNLTGNEFRNGAVFEARIVDRGDSTLLGGLGYTVNIGQAQQGDDIIIRLAAQNTATKAQYEGLRLFIQEGTGTGQYGYIAALDIVSKDVYIAREDFTPRSITGTNISGVITISDSSGLSVNQAVVLSGTNFGGLKYPDITDFATAEYYIHTIVSPTEIKLTDAIGNPAISLSTATGLMTLHLCGWNHVNEGTPIVTVLDTTTQYYIEPRVTFSTPGFTDTGGTLPSSISWSGIAYGDGVFVAVASNGSAVYSTNGTTWSTSLIPVAAWASVSYGNGRFVAVANGGTIAAYSVSGSTWTTVTIPAATYSAVTYADAIDTWVAVANGGTSAAKSTNNGSTWSAVTLPEGADWTDVAYGNGIFVAVATSDSSATQTAYSADGTTWTLGSYVGGCEAITFGNGRFVAIAGVGSTLAFYSFDGITWTASTLPGTAAHWRTITYGEGVFIAAITGSTSAALSYDGVTWTGVTLGGGGATWNAGTFGLGKFILIGGYGANSNTTRLISTGARTQGRATVVDGKVSMVSIWEPGSGYTSPPVITLTDPNNTADVAITVRINNGVIANPTKTNAGSGYFTETTDITITGDGFKDSYQIGKYIIVDNLSRAPRPGDNLFFGSINDYTYRVLQLEELAGAYPNKTARLTITKALNRAESPEHSEPITIRENYSQVRITGHDFLDMGLGNFVETNYPDTLNPVGSVLAPEREFVEDGGGRVFYTSTDQDGNFRVGELFAVEQSTGTVTLSADFFELEGLEELQLGGISAGGTGVVIREFSTDTKFTADSNNVVPTQRAIKAYVANRVSGGGSNAKTNKAISGLVEVGPQEITTTPGTQIDIPVKVNFTRGVDGDALALTMFMDGFNTDVEAD